MIRIRQDRLFKGKIFNFFTKIVPKSGKILSTNSSSEARDLVVFDESMDWVSRSVDQKTSFAFRFCQGGWFIKNYQASCFARGDW